MAQGEKTAFAAGEPGLSLWLGHGGLVYREEVGNWHNPAPQATGYPVRLLA